MEAGALNTSAVLPGLAARSPLMRLKGDEQLIALTRKGQTGAFEALVQRYQSRLLAFCRHMLGSTEDAEDVLQEVFAAAFNAMLADERSINARPWLYRIARNRCLNHLRRPTSAGQDTMDIFQTDGGATTADTVHRREEFRQIVADVQDLPETQRTALLLREIDALSYDDIAHAMDTTVPSVKSLLVRARVSLAEAAEARLLTCDEVRMELGQVAEGLAKSSAPVRRHLKSCERCRVFRGELRRANRALAVVYPLGPLVLVKKFLTAKVGLGAGTASGGSGAAGAGGLAAGSAAAASSAGGVVSAGLSTVASKAVAGFAAAAIVTAGAVEAKHATQREPVQRAAVPSYAPKPKPATPPPAPVAIAAVPAIEDSGEAVSEPAKRAAADSATKPAEEKEDAAAPVQPAEPVATDGEQTTTTTAPPGEEAPTQTGGSQQETTQEDGSTVVLEESDGSGGGDGSGDGEPARPSSPPGESPSSPPQPQPAPVVGDPNRGSGPRG
jgi:RNA polymerase sigma factor (sigma-70 family)